MRRLPLTKGKFALVDDEDYDRVSRHKWHAILDRGRWYAARMMRIMPGKRIRQTMHRFILYMPTRIVDHKDLNGLNNQKSNLRLCTYLENSRNRTKTNANSSGYKGVRINHGRYIQAFIVAEKKQIHLGTFPDLISAAKAYDAKAKEIFVEYARLNFPQP